MFEAIRRAEPPDLPAIAALAGLNVNKHNAVAIAAYERCGFRIASGVEIDIGGGFVMDDWVMERAL